MGDGERVGEVVDMTEPVSTREKLACVERELALRRSAYPKWVKAGRMKPHVASHEIRAMEAIVEDYRNALANASGPAGSAGTVG